MPATFAPPAPVRRAARRGLDLRAAQPPSRRGGTPVGLARARDLASGRPVSLATIKRMRSFFFRHDGDVERHRRLTDPTSRAMQAWLLWGGDPGRRWCEAVYRAEVER